jgi:hypothetical protein
MILMRSVGSAVVKILTSGVAHKVVEHSGKKAVDVVARMIGRDRRPGYTVLRVDDYRHLPKLILPAGYCYIIRDEEQTNRHRIGMVSQPFAELKKLKMETPFEVVVVAILECANVKDFEQKLRDEFAQKRVGGSN